jgi:hypothetical protein
LTGLALFLWLLTLAGQVDALFSLNGWFDRAAYLAASQLPEPDQPVIGWSLLYLAGSDHAALNVLYILALVSAGLFTAGVATRITGVLTWVLAVSFLANPVTRGDAEELLCMTAFYLMIGYLLLGLWNRNLTPAQRILGTPQGGLLGLFSRRGRKPEREPNSYAANLVTRLWQVHFALIMVVSGFHKLQFGDWWSGMGLWYPLHPPFETTMAVIRSEAAYAGFYLFVISLAQYLVLAWQIGFPFFAWSRRWRPLLFTGAAFGVLGSIVLYRQPLFGLVVLIGCLNYLTPAEWQRFLAILTQGRGRSQSRSAGEVAAKGKLETSA